MNSPSPTVTIAYFSMEIALDEAMPTYSGGLGVLAGDTLRAAADLGVPMAAVTLLHRKGYFRQRLTPQGDQFEEPAVWHPEQVLEPMSPLATVTIEGRPVQIRAWRYLIRGVSGHSIPVYLLDTALEENTSWDQTLTDFLYGGDDRYRLCQEVVLGMGGARMLRLLGHEEIENYHMNEGHSALLVLELLEQRWEESDLGNGAEDEIEAVRRRCIFTTHTPVPAGHDQFSRTLVRRVLGEERAALLSTTRFCPDGSLNMTFLALGCSRYVNGVAMSHGEISQGLFPRYPIRAITNGVHAATWTSPPFQELFDRHIPEWRYDNLYLRYAVGMSLPEIQRAHAEAKHILLEEVKARTGAALSAERMTIGFARRATAYKRADLLFRDLDRLRRIANRVGPFQLVYAGKAHPRDAGGKTAIRKVFEAAEALKDVVTVVYVEDYDMRWGRLLSSGVDLWLNTPQRPNEASGTSGMKAALNGVPSFSVLDGWWVEGHVEGKTGWAIGTGKEPLGDPLSEVASLYDKLETVILPMFYAQPAAYAEVMRSTIALNGSFFNTQRMLAQYVSNAYSRRTLPPVPVKA